MTLGAYILSAVMCLLILYLSRLQSKRCEKMEKELQEKIRPHLAVLEDELRRLRAYEP